MAVYHTANSCNCAAAKQNSTVQLLCSSGLTSVSCLAISGNSCKFHRKLPLGDNLTTITCQDVTFAPHPSLMSAGLSGSPPLQKHSHKHWAHPPETRRHNKKCTFI